MDVGVNPWRDRFLGEDEFMNVRRATIDDAQSMASLNANVQQMHHEERPDWFKPVDENAIMEMYRNRLMDPTITTFIAEHDDLALGFVLAEVQVKPESALSWTQTTLYIKQICVAPSQRRRGVVASAMSFSTPFENWRVKYRPAR